MGIITSLIRGLKRKGENKPDAFDQRLQSLSVTPKPRHRPGAHTAPALFRRQPHHA